LYDEELILLGKRLVFPPPS